MLNDRFLNPLTMSRPLRRLLVLVWYQQQGEDRGVPPVSYRPTDSAGAGIDNHEEGQGAESVWLPIQQGGKFIKE